MPVSSVRLKLTLLYVITVFLLLAVFIGADMIGLKHNLMQQVEEQALSESALNETWLRAIYEHLALAAILVSFVFVFGYAFIRRALNPVRQIARTAKSISEKDLSLRIDKSGDMAEVGELEDTLNDMISRLEKSFIRTKRFSSDAAHELSTPLTILRGEIEVTLRNQRTSAEYVSTLGKLLSQIEKMSVLVENLLFLSRTDEKNFGKSSKSVFIDNILLSAYEMLNEIAIERDIKIHIEEIAEVKVLGDAELLQRMIENIIGNAIKFTQNTGEISIQLLSFGDRFELSIKDSGSGIPEEDIPHIFDRFYRVEKSRSKETGGAGLGLAIVDEIAKLHNITIDIESDSVQGTNVIMKGKTG